MRTTITRFAAGLLVAFLVSMLYTAYWGLIRRDALLERDDNPRRILDISRIQRGTIYDRDGLVLAESVRLPDGTVQRRYPVPEVAPAVGYYSIRYGEGGIEAAFDDELSGAAYLTSTERWQIEALNRAPIGADLRLTLDRGVQAQTEKLLLPGQQGAIVVIEADTGHIIAMASRPSFDPNQLDNTFERLSEDPSAPLLNRSAQSLYQPGTIIQNVVYATALNYNTFTLQAEWDGARTVRVDDTLLSCSGTPSADLPTISDLAYWSCPAPLRTAQSSLEDRFLLNSFDDFGLLTTPELPIQVAPPTFDPNGSVDMRMLAIGQSDLTVSPLQMALVTAAFSNEGIMPAPQLTAAVRPPGEQWQPVSPTGNPRTVLSPAANQQIVNLMRESVQQGAAQPAALTGYDVYGQAGLAVSGVGDSFTSWFIGFTYTDDGQPIVVTVVIEEERNAALAAQLGSLALQTTLNNITP